MRTKEVAKTRCPNCGSKDTYKDGLKYGLGIKQRYHCKNCRHKFYIEIEAPKPKKSSKQDVKKKMKSFDYQIKKTAAMAREQIDYSPEIKKE